ncbi:uncharacterized protein LOC115753254 isoform X2 [Rhodamnia argentea]|uniref:Uncharacterized protein LOC115753254 isoform X2 n=1 Tax=Rhodamnia argentea TaxID=178133 RepID=A0A8B8QKD4_9MYRT|nr:uncharacterized protein LOC115753254 isoform X2 [Rhodamnia argentea]
MNISSESYGVFVIFSVRLTLAMQIVGFSVRLSSSFIWIQIYRLGVSSSETVASQEPDFDLRNSFLSPVTPAAVGRLSDSDDVLGGSIYDPAYFSSLFEDRRDNGFSHGVKCFLTNFIACFSLYHMRTLSLSAWMLLCEMSVAFLWIDKGCSCMKLLLTYCFPREIFAGLEKFPWLEISMLSSVYWNALNPQFLMTCCAGSSMFVHLDLVIGTVADGAEIVGLYTSLNSLYGFFIVLILGISILNAMLLLHFIEFEMLWIILWNCLNNCVLPYRQLPTLSA